jgi:hypothetical protein
MTLAWHILEKEVLVTFDELDWTVRKRDQGVAPLSPKSESNDPKADSGTGTCQAQNKEQDEKHDEEVDEGPLKVLESGPLLPTSKVLVPHRLRCGSS